MISHKPIVFLFNIYDSFLIRKVTTFHLLQIYTWFYVECLSSNHDTELMDVREVYEQHSELASISFPITAEHTQDYLDWWTISIFSLWKSSWLYGPIVDVVLVGLEQMQFSMLLFYFESLWHYERIKCWFFAPLYWEETLLYRTSTFWT